MAAIESSDYATLYANKNYALKENIMNRSIFKNSIVLFLTLLVVTTINGQSALSLDKKSSMAINGTSTLHDWESDVETINLKGTATIENGKLKSIESLYLTVPVKSIKSGKGGMDKKTYEALKDDLFSQIKFDITSASINNKFINGEGKLTVAGKTKVIRFNPEYNYVGSSTIRIKGYEEIDMTDYNIEPPEALLGSVVAGKNVQIHYDLYINY